MRRDSKTALLTRHFLRRFLDNDLISPHVDLHENVALFGAGLMSATLFLAVGLASDTLFGLPTPGVTAIMALSDNFFFLGASMVMMALATAVQWDALSLDARDTFNLGPLPIERRAILRAKLTAVLVFALGLDLALNLLPSVIYQALLVSKIPVGLGGLVRLTIVHLTVGLGASAFGFFAVLAMRELLRLGLGPNLFARVSTFVQAGLVFLLLSAMLLMPAAASAVSAVGGWAARGFAHPYLLPPLWFLSLEQRLDANLIVNAPLRIFSPRLQQQHRVATAMYYRNEALFAELSIVALVALIIVASLAVMAYAWNVRRLPQPVASSRGHGRVLNLLTRTLGGRHSVTKAGFSFGLQALVRSAPHRLSMASAAAVAIAMGFLMFGRIDRAVTPWFPPRALLAIQIVMLTILLGGFRRAIRVPAELPANWILQLAWRHGEQRFLAGVKRIALVAIAIPCVLLLMPLHAWFVSDRVLIGHAAVGVAFTVATIEALFSGYRKVPFASSYQPPGNIKTLGPLVVFAFFVFLLWFSSVERAALQSTEGTMLLLASLIAVAVVFRLLGAWRRRGRPQHTFEELPEPATQWLGLSG